MSAPATRSRFVGLRCQRCAAWYDESRMFEGCPACRDGEWAASLIAEYDLTGALGDWQRLAGRGVWRYRPFLPVTDQRVALTLGEGGTPLLSLPGNGWAQLWLKNESVNPTWSYKDRLNVVAVAKAVELGEATVAASSTGNHGASAAAYAASAGLRAVVFTREDVDAATLLFMRSYGACVVRTSPRGRWAQLRRGVHEDGWYPVSTYTPAPAGNPYGVEGYKTVAFEIYEELGIPDLVVVPTSYGEGLAGIWAGFAVLREIGLTDRAPRMVAVEPAGGGPLTMALDERRDRVAAVPAYRTVAGSIAATTATDRALLALRDSGGTAVRLNDEEIITGQLRLARRGVFLEPAGAAGFAALPALPGRLPGLDPATATCVVIGTAGGLRQVGLLAGRLPEELVTT